MKLTVNRLIKFAKQETNLKVQIAPFTHLQEDKLYYLTFIYIKLVNLYYCRHKTSSFEFLNENKFILYIMGRRKCRSVVSVCSIACLPASSSTADSHYR